MKMYYQCVRSDKRSDERFFARRLYRWKMGVGILLLLNILATACATAEEDNAITQTPTYLFSTPSGKTNNTGTLQTITLITGDRVIVSGQNLNSVTIQPAAGRAGIRFFKQRVSLRAGEEPHLYVIPEDARSLIAANRVDRRLFDVTLLLDYEYDDAHRDSLPLIITDAESTVQARALGTRTAGGAVIDNYLSSINGVAATLSKRDAQTLWRDVASSQNKVTAKGGGIAKASGPVGKIWLDGLLRPVLDVSVPMIGAPSAWTLGYEGNGVVVAVLDTGIDDTHPDLAEQLIESRNFTLESDFDEIGHGTHVASTIAGSGAASEGLYRGVAPGVQLVSGKVCGFEDCPESAIIAGMEWAVEEADAQIVNISIGGYNSPDIDPVEEAVNHLSEEFDTLFVVAAGNSGPDAGSVESPGSAAAALTVGAVDKDDQLAYFSGRGLTKGDEAVKPDVTAPGVDIVAALAAGTMLDMPVDDWYVMASGTSMATPHVAGAAALLLEQHPEWGPDEIKAALMGAAAYNPEWTVPDQGAGRIDVESALDISIITETSSVSFGIARWPHDDDLPITRTVTFRNLGPTAELQLELEMIGPDGAVPPVDMFTVDSSRVSLPENDTVSVSVTADTSLDVPDGVYSGRLIASDSADRIVSIPVVAIREAESYDLTLRYLDMSGAPGPFLWGTIVGLDEFFVKDLISMGEPGDITMRLPAGRYMLETFNDNETIEECVRMLAPNITLTEDVTLELDERQTTPIDIIPPSPDAESGIIEDAWVVPTNSGLFTFSFMGFNETDTVFYVGEFGPSNPDVYSHRVSEWTDMTTEAFYNAAWYQEGVVLDPIAMDRRRMSPVHAHYAAPLTTPGSEPPMALVAVGSFPNEALGLGWSLHDVTLPLDRMEYYYSPQRDMPWVNEVWMFGEHFLRFGNVPRVYPPRRQISTQWNRPPFSVVLPQAHTFDAWAYRSGDMLIVDAPMYGDRNGNAGSLSGGEGQSELYLNGELIGESNSGSGGYFDVPPEPGQYRLKLTDNQSMLVLSTQQEVDWTFFSNHVDEGESQLLPLLTVRFTPELNDAGEARTGRRFRLPFQVEQYGNPWYWHIGRPTLNVSFDDGATWTPVRVRRRGQNWQAIFDHPVNADYVSLRANARDYFGNAVTQTIIRAYALEH